MQSAFAFQRHNNRTRLAEYPWIAEAIEKRKDSIVSVLDLGERLAGPQFVLAMQGFRVTNVDPGLWAQMGWSVGRNDHAALARALRCTIQLVDDHLQNAALVDGSFDAVISVSTLKHIPPPERPDLARAIGRVLRRGYFIATIDLFFDLPPSTSRLQNRHGSNCDVRQFSNDAGLELLEGDRKAIYGFPEFVPERVQSRLDYVLLGDMGPCVPQALVLQKPLIRAIPSSSH